MAMTRFPALSRWKRLPGGTTVVALYSVMMAGPEYLLAGAEIVSGVDFRFEFLAIELDWGFERGRPAELCSAWTGRMRPSPHGQPLHMVFSHVRGLHEGAEAEGY